MATWRTFTTEAPAMADIAARLWPGITELERGHVSSQGQPCFAISYLASIRRNGGPRLHPFCPILANGSLYAVILSR